MLTIRQGNREWRLPVQPERRLMEVLREQGIVLQAPCGSMRRCGQCKVTLDVATPWPLGLEEQRLLSAAEIARGLRLACFLPAEGLLVTIPESARAAVQTEFLGGVGCFQGNRQGLGIAADIGTTTLAMYLVDIESGKTLAERSALNAQKPYGDDVVTRMQYAMEHEGGARRLTELLRAQLVRMSEALCAENGVLTQEIAAAALVANTALMHFLLGLPTGALARAPFTPAALQYPPMDAADLGFSFAKGAQCVFAPSAAAYVGGDIVAGVLATGLRTSEKPTLLVDIGTNGEIVLAYEDKLLCCATAAGPAFEGAHIACGLGGVTGAIRRFSLDAQGRPVYETIDGAPPAGLCGSGLLDVVAALLDAGIVDETGRMDGAFFSVAGELRLANQDIREVQLAKAAIAAGIETLLHHAGIRANDLDQVFIAGGFGSAMDQASAFRIGLLPNACVGKAVSVGNAAAAGAIRLLTGVVTAEEAQFVAQRMACVELTTDARFHQYFIDAMLFPERE